MDHGTLDPVELPSAPAAARRYLDLLKGCLTRELFIDEEVREVVWWPANVGLGEPKAVWDILESRGWLLVRPTTAPGERTEGRDYPPRAETMVGRSRLDNVEELIQHVLADDIPGDLVETGIWRGGTVIFMRAVLEAYGDSERTVWACDSFEGLPVPDEERYPVDAALRIEGNESMAPGQQFLMRELLAVPAEKVRANLARYGYDDDRVRLVEGWFSDTLPTAPIEEIALLRLDGDLYESTIDALVHLEPKVSPGGFVVIDDYNSIEACEAAVTDYRADNGIVDPIHEIDWTGVWWRKRAR
ncbi:MAG: class I SAM-dependent methyltransferase [Acidimicrobiia bacterium]|nr:class I SAM-dependent methyltransferase [Acidimicrobiia bacterium]